MSAVERDPEGSDEVVDESAGEAAGEPDDAAWAEVTPDAARRLLVAAVDAFAERGYHATTTRDIAGRAGMSPAALYIHYKTKEELLHRISRIGHDRALKIMRDAADSGAPRPNAWTAPSAPSWAGTPCATPRPASSSTNWTRSGPSTAPRSSNCAGAPTRPSAR